MFDRSPRSKVPASIPGPAPHRPEPRPAPAASADVSPSVPFDIRSLPIYPPAGLPVPRANHVGLPYRCKPTSRQVAIHSPVAQLMLRRKVRTQGHDENEYGRQPQAQNEAPQVQRQSSYSSSQSLTSSAQASLQLPVHRFDEVTKQAFIDRTGGADIKSEDKVFHHLGGDDETTWAVASGGTIEREHAALAHIQKLGGPTVLAEGKGVVPVSVEGKDGTTTAYGMHWIPGAVSSKSKTTEFHKHLSGLSGEKLRAAQSSMDRFREVAKQIDVSDFQSVLHPESGTIYANDPRSHRVLQPPETAVQEHGELEHPQEQKKTFMSSRLDEWQRSLDNAHLEERRREDELLMDEEQRSENAKGGLRRRKLHQIQHHYEDKKRV